MRREGTETKRGATERWDLDTYHWIMPAEARSRISLHSGPCRPWGGKHGLHTVCINHFTHPHTSAHNRSCINSCQLKLYPPERVSVSQQFTGNEWSSMTRTHKAACALVVPQSPSTQLPHPLSQHFLSLPYVTIKKKNKEIARILHYDKIKAINKENKW